MRALLLNPDHPSLHGDVRTFTKLLRREHEAHRAFGDAGSLVGVHDVALEEEAVMRAVGGRRLTPQRGQRVGSMGLSQPARSPEQSWRHHGAGGGATVHPASVSAAAASDWFRRVAALICT